MTESSVAEKITELNTNRQEALQALQEAQGRVTELNALIQRQSGAITALEQLQQDASADKEIDESHEIS
jgi:lipase chaperone LimK